MSESPETLAFQDVHPQAPTHILVIPKKHVSSIAGMEQKDASFVGGLFAEAARIAREKNLDKNGYRLVVNHSSHGGQTVPHLHIHILGGRAMKWPPG